MWCSLLGEVNNSEYFLHVVRFSCYSLDFLVYSHSAFYSSLQKTICNMKIMIKEGEYEFSYDSNVEHPDVEDAVFSACYLLSKIYSVQQVRQSLENVLKDI